MSKPWRADWKSMLSLGTEAGVCARRRSNFLSSRRKKVTKERATLHAASLRFAAGNLRCSGVGRAVELALRCARRSDNHGKLEHEARALRRPCRPTPCAPRRIVKGTRDSDIHTGHRCARPILRSAWRLRPRDEAERSNGPWGCSAVHPLLAAPAAGRLWGGMGVEAPMLRELTRRGCPSGAAQQQSEFHGAPRNRPDAGLPRSEAQGSQTGGRLFFAYFLLAKQKKVSRLPGRQPGSRPKPKHAFQTSTPRLRQTQPKREIKTKHSYKKKAAGAPKNQRITLDLSPPDKPPSPQGQTPSARAQPLPPTGVPPPPTPPWSPETQCCRSSKTSR